VHTFVFSTSITAFHDPLTKLSNRNSLFNSLSQRQKQNSDFILLQLNLRRIKEVNDTLGHKVGDQVIIEVAKRLQQCALSNEHFHLGGNSFVIIVENQDIEYVIASILPALEKKHQYESISLQFQYVIGVAYSLKQQGKDVAEILQRSNVALQYAKKQKKLYQVYDSQFDTNTVERLHLTNSLKTAIEQNQLVLFYQPKLSLSTMKLSHVEALVRWQHPEKGLIPTDSFISIAEKTGQMDALTRWVTQEVIAQYLRWQKAGLHLKIAINISAENLLDKSYSDYVIGLKKQYNLPDNDITLEVTEDAVVADPEQATQILSYLREHGLKLSIDDYGTGYSSLALNEMNLLFDPNNPLNKNEGITLRHLVTHTSGIRDSEGYDCSYFVHESGVSLYQLFGEESYPENATTDSTTFFTNGYFNENGRYVMDGIYNDDEEGFPDITHEYSNVAAGLAGYAVEQKLNINFANSMKESFFTPLNMNNTAWRHTELSEANPKAIQYTLDEDLDPIEVPEYSYPTFYDGDLNTSANDLAKFLITIINGGEYQGNRILKQETVDIMLSSQTEVFNQRDTQGGFWYWKGAFVGHGGGDPGTNAIMQYNTTTKTGIVVLMNGEDGYLGNEEVEGQLLPLMSTLYRYDLGQ
jgi:diguanylate cyclase (GGDEF)-like protein